MKQSKNLPHQLSNKCYTLESILREYSALSQAALQVLEHTSTSNPQVLLEEVSTLLKEARKSLVLQLAEVLQLQTEVV